MTKQEYSYLIEYIDIGLAQYYNLTILPIFIADIFLFYGVDIL